jgi:hypothetical protein
VVIYSGGLGWNRGDSCLLDEQLMDDRHDTHTHKWRHRAPAWLPGWFVVRKVIRIVLGVLLIVVGLLALFTPLTPGSWLALVGLEILGLRVLLRDWLCAWAEARPASRFRRMICRVLRPSGLKAVRRKWRQHKEAQLPGDRRHGSPSEVEQEDSRAGETRSCEAPPVGTASNAGRLPEDGPEAG